MIFAVLFVTATLGAAILIGVYVSGVIGAIAFGLIALALYGLATHQSGPDRASGNDHLNAFQKLSDDS